MTFSLPKNPIMKHILLSILAFAALGGTALAAVGDKATLPTFTQEHISGPEITAEELEGKVIFFEYWGINCPPCIASMPHLQKLHKKYGKKGFTVLGAHSQGLTPEVAKFLKKNKITFPVYQGLSIPEAPCPGGIPYAVLIDHEGNVAATGRPSELYDKVPELMKAAKKGKSAKKKAAKKKAKDESAAESDES